MKELNTVELSDIEVTEETTRNTDLEMTRQPFNNQLDNKTWLAIIQESSIFSLTVSAAQLNAAIGSFAGSVMLARLSLDMSAASALIASSRNVLMLLSRAPLVSVNNRVSQLLGEENHQAVGSVFRQGMVLGTLSHLPIIIAFATIKPLLMILGQPAVPTQFVENYYQGQLVASPLYGAYFSTIQLAIGLKQQGFFFITSFLNNAIFAGMSYIFIYNIAPGSPSVQARGHGYAHALGLSIAAAFLGIFLSIHPAFRKYGLFNFRQHSELQELKRLAQIGWPITLSIAGEIASNFCITLLAGLLGKEALAATNVSLQYSTLASIIAIGVFQSTSTLVSRAYSSNNLVLARRYGNVGVGVGLVYAALFLVVIAAAPEKFTNFFLNDEQQANRELQCIAKNMLLITMAGQIFETLRRSLGGALYGLRDTKVPVLMDLGILWGLGLPFSYLLGNVADMGVYGLAAGNATAFAISSGILAWRWWRQSAQPFQASIEPTTPSLKQSAQNVVRNLYQSGMAFFSRCITTQMPDSAVVVTTSEAEFSDNSTNYHTYQNNN